MGEGSMKNRRFRLPAVWLCVLALAFTIVGCGGSSAAAPASAAEEPKETAAAAPTAQPKEAQPVSEATPESAPAEEGPALPGLKYLRAMEKKYAVQFDVYYYEGGYKYLVIGDGNRYLIVPEGKSAPDGLDKEIKVLRQPLNRIYLAGTSCMALFDAMDSLDVIKLSSMKAEDCYVDRAAEAIRKKEIQFGGKYSEPDYELLVNSNISVAIENTMILHTPKVIDMIEMLGIPVFIEYSSYEPHPLGRTEWIKLFAAMIDREDAAERFYNEKVALMEKIQAYPSTGKTVAIFLIDSTGKAQVRSSDDYLSKIIDIAGGKNPFTYVTVEDSGRTNVNMTMEEFYATAMDVDYLIYNASGYSGGVTTLNKLLEMSSLLADCRAFKEGNIWWIGPETYQRSDKLSDLIADVHSMLDGDDDSGMTFLHRME